MTRPTILVVEDEASIAETITYALQTEGYTPVWKATGGEALAVVGQLPVALVILDVGLPDLSGFDVCRELQKRGAPPVIFLTARSHEVDKIVGLELGADDYLAKPFSPNELVARVRALLRRAQRHEIPSGRPLTYGGIVVDPERHTVALDGREVALTAKEFLLLSYLLQHRGRVLSRDVLLEQVWGYRYTGGTRTVDVHVRRLRSKIEDASHTFIETVRNVGYRFHLGGAAQPGHE